jgi:Protein of unknown function DUF262
MEWAADKAIEVKHEVVFLGKLLEELIQGKIRIPRFKRPFVWRQVDMLRLLDSVARGYPIGGVLLFETRHVVSSHDHVGPILVGASPSGRARLVLDGEQRLATLAGCLMMGERDDARAEDVSWDIYFDLWMGGFVTKSRGELGPYFFPVRDLLLTSRYLEATRRLLSDNENHYRTIIRAADDLANAFRNYQIPVTTVRSASISTIVDIFARVHVSGRSMSADQMISALTFREGEFHLADALDSLAADLARRGFGNLDRALLLRTVLLAEGRDLFSTDWADLVADESVRHRLPKSLKDATRGLLSALDFLGEQGVTSDRVLPYGMQLVLLAETMRTCPNPSKEVHGLLERWFWFTSFTSWFSGIGIGNVQRMLEEMREVARGERSSYTVVDLSIETQPFPSRFDLRSARVRAFLLYLTSLRPRSILQKEEELDPSRLLSTLGGRALGRIVVDIQAPELRQSPANRMFIDEDHHGSVWKSLAVVFPGHGDLLASHGFPPESTQLIANNDGEGLIRSRLRELIEGERRFMQARGLTPSHAEQGNVLADTDTADDEVE